MRVNEDVEQDDRQVLHGMTSEDLGAERYFALDWEPRPHVSYWLLAIEVDVLRGAEVASERDAVEQLAHLALVHRHVVEQSQQQREQTDDQHQRDPDQEDFAPTVVVAERDEGHQSVRRQEPENETEQVRVVVHPGQNTD